MINNYPNNSLKLQTIKELEDKLIDVSGYIGNLGNSNNTETAKVISLALIALKIWSTQQFSYMTQINKKTEKKMENLVNKIQEILDINVTSYRISKITGITELVLSKYRKGTYNIKNMSLETADKLISNISEIEKYAKWTNKSSSKTLSKF